MNLDIRESFEKTRIAGSIAAGALDEVSKIISPGITTDQIDKLCYEYINDHGAYSAPLFYRGFLNLAVHHLTTLSAMEFQEIKN